MSKLFLITGVNGIGKTTLITELAGKLDKNTFGIHDFDERGVPDNADKNWRQSETSHWVEVGKDNQKNGGATVICGFMKFAEIRNSLALHGMEANVCLLDANKDVITGRILGRYTTPESVTELERTTSKTPEKFAADNLWVSSKFRTEAKESGYFVVDTSNLSPAEVGEEISAWILAD
jgi:broad-specificity NMP kinase